MVTTGAKEVTPIETAQTLIEGKPIETTKEIISTTEALIDLGSQMNWIHPGLAKKHGWKDKPTKYMANTYGGEPLHLEREYLLRVCVADSKGADVELDVVFMGCEKSQYSMLLRMP